MNTCDFAVIGAGIAGASAAYELALHGRVVLLERESLPGYHTTGRSAAMFTEHYGNSIIRRLTVASRSFLENPPEGFTATPLVTPRGSILIAREDQLGSLQKMLAEIQTYAPSVQTADGAEARRLCPALRQDYIAGALMEPGAMDMDVNAIHQGLLSGLKRRKGELVTQAEVTRLARSSTGWEVTTAQGAWSAAVVVNAAGAWCDEVARLAAVQPVGLRPLRRTAFIFDGPAGVDFRRWPDVSDIDEQFYFKPEAGRILASPCDETPMPPCDVQPDDYDVAEAASRIERAATLEIRNIRRKWAGLRSFVGDRTPVVGMDSGTEGFFWLAGQGGYGIMTSPAMGRVVASLIVEGRMPEDLAAMGLKPADLSPARLR